MSSITINAPRSEGATKNVLEGTVIGILLTALSYVVALKFGWIETVNYLEAFAVFTSYVCTYLCVKERRINYPIGAISTAAYAILFWQSGLVASAALNLYLTPTLVYGWFRWRADKDTRPVGHVQWKMVPIYLVVSAVVYFGAVWLITALGGTLAFTDTLILVGTVLAQFLLDNKKLENWIVWAAVNVFAIYTYASVGLPLVAFQYVFFLGNTIYGFVSWRKSMHNEEALQH